MVEKTLAMVFSAHGVAPSVHANADARSLRTIDATCPLVTKVHVEARKFAEQGYTIVLIGHQGHEEVEGTTGEAPENIVLVETVADGPQGRLVEGRADHQGPEVDGTTQLGGSAGERPTVGDLVLAVMVASEGADLVAEPVR